MHLQETKFFESRHKIGIEFLKVYKNMIVELKHEHKAVVLVVDNSQIILNVKFRLYSG
jgi:hypothetical protein